MLHLRADTLLADGETSAEVDGTAAFGRHADEGIFTRRQRLVVTDGGVRIDDGDTARTGQILTGGRGDQQRGVAQRQRSVHAGNRQVILGRGTQLRDGQFPKQFRISRGYDTQRSHARLFGRILCNREHGLPRTGEGLGRADDGGPSRLPGDDLHLGTPFEIGRHFNRISLDGIRRKAGTARGFDQDRRRRAQLGDDDRRSGKFPSAAGRTAHDGDRSRTGIDLFILRKRKNDASDARTAVFLQCQPAPVGLGNGGRPLHVGGGLDHHDDVHGLCIVLVHPFRKDVEFRGGIVLLVVAARENGARGEDEK